MTGKLVDPTYVAGPEDELAVVDVYGKGDSGVVNSFQEKHDSAIDAVDNTTPLSEEEILAELEGLNNDDLLADAIDPLAAVEEALNEDVEAMLEGIGDFDVFNDVSSLADQLLGDVGEFLGGDLASVTCLAKGFSDKLSSFNGFSAFDQLNAGFDLDNIVNNITNGVSDVFSAIGDLPRQFQGMMNGGLPLDVIKNNVFSSVGGVMTRVTPGMNYSGIDPINSITNNLTNGSYNAQISNRGGLAALVSAVSHIGNKLNLPNVFGAIAQTVTDPAILMAAATPLLQRAIHQGDSDMFRNIAGTSVGPQMRSLVPGMVNALMTNLTKPTYLAQQEYPRYYQSMRSSMDRVQPGWQDYSRPGGTVVNTAIIQSNPFMCDLVRSQMNEFMHPDNYLSNAQSAYPERVRYEDTPVVNGVVVSNPINSGVVIQPISSSNVEARDIDFTTLGDAVGPNDLEISQMTSGGEVITSFDNEPFMLLGQVFRKNSVDDEMQRHFPAFYQTFDAPIDPISYD